MGEECSGNIFAHEEDKTISRRTRFSQIERDRALDNIQAIKTSSGANALRKYIKGKYISRKEALLAKCCDCMGYYEDGLRKEGVNG